MKVLVPVQGYVYTYPDFSKHKMMVTGRWTKFVTKFLSIPRQANDSGKVISFLWISGECQTLRVFQHDSVLGLKYKLGLNHHDKLVLGKSNLGNDALVRLEEASVVSVVRGQVVGLKIRVFTKNVVEIDVNSKSEYPSDCSLEEVLKDIFAHERVIAKMLPEQKLVDLKCNDFTYESVRTMKFETFSGDSLEKTTKIEDIPDELEESNEKIVKLVHPTFTLFDKYKGIGDKGVKRGYM